MMKIWREEKKKRWSSGEGDGNVTREVFGFFL